MSTTLVPKTNDFFPAAFDDLFNNLNEWSLNGLRRKTTLPAVNVKETPRAYEISLATPGLQKDDFHIDVDNATLTITAEKEDKKETRDEKVHREEYNYSSFRRSFSIPEDVSAEKIEAVYTDGILRLSLPRKESAKTSVSKQIYVK